MDRKTAKEALEKFLSLDISTAKGVLDIFAALPGAIAHYDGEKNNFVYVPGTRADRVLLVAHADTVWDSLYANGEGYKQTLTKENGVYHGSASDCGIGADDRAGCAMLWLLRDTGHSLLIVDGEEVGQIGSKHIRDNYPEIFDELNRHSYMIQLDRRDHMNYKVYDLPVPKDFTDFIEKSTTYKCGDRLKSTDIVVLCRDVSGANLSIGYYGEHTPNERLVFEEWLHTLTVVEELLRPEQKRFPLNKQ